jgi:hypothetical protein
MLAQTIVLVALLAIFASSAVAQVAGMARAQTADAAKALMLPAIETALARYQGAIAATLGAQAGAVPEGAALVAPVPLPALAGPGPWTEQHYLIAPPGVPLAAAVDVLPTAQSVPVCGAAANAGPDLAVDAQCSPFVQESRLSLAITTDVGPADGAGNVTPLAHGRYAVTLRLFAQPPYSIVSGVKDATAVSDVHEGDTGGWGGALSALASPAPDDTTIHVVYRCADGTGSCAASNPPPPDAPFSLPWTDGNGVP